MLIVSFFFVPFAFILDYIYTHLPKTNCTKSFIWTLSWFENFDLFEMELIPLDNVYK